jgi:thiamine-monophosphate kinase
VKEFELIELLTRSLPANDSVVLGAGDDCAVLDLGLREDFVLLKTDAVVEGVHFTSATEREKIGHKALGRCLSDIAAMGGTPSAAVITVGLPSGYNAEEINSIYDGLRKLATRYNVAIVGGETTQAPSGLFLSVAVIGRVSKSRCIRRAGAKAGDAIFVTGELGGSLGGRHLEFEPRVEQGRWLAEHFAIHAMIDISDGLAGDLRHLLRAGDVGAELFTRSIPISRAAKLQAKTESSAKPPLLAALTDGEDFELLFTLPSASAVPLLDAWKQQFPAIKLSCIGKITKGQGLKLRDAQGLRDFSGTGYEHFSKKPVS